MHGYTLDLLQGDEVLYANHNVYVNEGSPEEVTADVLRKTIFGN
jgi:tRNA (guanine-N7-)-methyltransferase